jgi:hypothetical protein
MLVADTVELFKLVMELKLKAEKKKPLVALMRQLWCEAPHYAGSLRRARPRAATSPRPASSKAAPVGSGTAGAKDTIVRPYWLPSASGAGKRLNHHMLSGREPGPESLFSSNPPLAPRHAAMEQRATKVLIRVCMPISLGMGCPAIHVADKA